MKKKICLTLSRVFPKTHRRAGEPTGFSDKLASGAKKHTIRRNYDLWQLNAEKMQRGGYALSIRQWTDKPYRSKQREIYVQNEPIRVQKVAMHYDSKNDNINVSVEHTLVDAEYIAKNDGLSLEDFKDWFFGSIRHKEDAHFNGVVIHFKPFSY